ncbi:V-type proton ATPase subunit S1-like [Ornithodoros turicata]|uniref:V-type proton ATPase subunit S1-like n=1 Tax=Ornithodoros turicata TaxID=34597 RepID=UPI00313957F8
MAAAGPPLREMYYFVLLVSLASLYNCENVEVPAFLWGHRGEQSSFPAVSAFQKISHGDFTEKFVRNVLSSKDTVLAVFIQDSLSVEDLQPDGPSFKYLKLAFKNNPVLMLPAVENPVDAISSLKGVKTVQVSVRDPASAKEKLQDHNEHTNVILLELPSTQLSPNRDDALKNIDDIIESSMQQLTAGGRNVVGLYTGRRPSFGGEESGVRTRRHLLQAPPVEKNASDVYGVLMLRSECLILYCEAITVSFASHENRTSKASYTYNDTLPAQPVPECSSKGANLTIHFPDEGGITGFSILLTIAKSGADGYMIENITADMGTYKDLAMRMGDTWWPANFSYSCGDSSFRQRNVTKEPHLQLTFTKLQVELFPNSTDAPFSESYDCSGFFTMPVWMGLLVILLYLVILGVGIFFLHDIRTNDRFDDPKGKTITVTATD